MTSMPVMDKSLYSAGGVSAQKSPTKNADVTESFGTVMEKAGGNSQTKSVKTKENEAADVKNKPQNETTKSDETSTEKTENTQKSDEASETEKVKTPKDAKETKETSEASAVEDETIDESELAVMTDAATVILTTIAQIMDLPQEVVEQTMNDLDMESLDLLQEGGVKDLMVALAADGDRMSLLTDETLYAQVSQVLETLENVRENLQQELEMTPNDFQAVLTHMTQPDPDENALTVETEPVFTVKAETKMAEQMPTNETLKDSETVKQSEVKQPELAEEKVEPQTHRQTQQPTENEESHGGMQQEHTPFQTYNTPAQTTANVMQQTAEVQDYVYIPDTKEIMDQIMEYMKVSAKPEITTLQMQLHPESLGNLHIQISSKEGLMTAQFTAENETVKAVLESQMITLRENLEQQGVKVEAVEVTIAEYSLDRDTQQDTEQRNEEAAREIQKKTRRIINLSDLDLEADDLSVEEKLTAEIMQAQGSTVNYTA